MFDCSSHTASAVAGAGMQRASDRHLVFNGPGQICSGAASAAVADIASVEPRFRLGSMHLHMYEGTDQLL